MKIVTNNRLRKEQLKGWAGSLGPAQIILQEVLRESRFLSNEEIEQVREAFANRLLDTYFDACALSERAE